MSLLDELEMSVRTSNVLRNLPPCHAVNTIEDFMALTREVVLDQRRAGVKTWREIENLQTYLRGDHANAPKPPDHPTALPDEVMAKLVSVAGAYGYRIEALTLQWDTTAGWPPIARVAYDVSQTATAEDR